nr:hypothetical protein [uncultured Lachnoclostridium sp.]
MKSLRKIMLMIVMIIGLSTLYNSSNIYAASSVTPSDIESNSSLPNERYYITSATTYVYKNSQGRCAEELKLEDFIREVKKYYLKQFIEMGSDANRFVEKTDIFKNIDYTGTTKSPMKTQNVTNIFKGAGSPSGTFDIKVNSKTYKFYIPCYTYESYVNEAGVAVTTPVYLPKTNHTSSIMQKEGLIAESSNIGIKSIIDGVKIGLIAGNIQKGFNIGSVYSTNQKSLNDVMTPINGSSLNTSGGNSTATTTPVPESSTSLENTVGTFFKFKMGKTLKATMDYFMCPLFGRINLEDLPKTDADWEAKITELDALITDDTIRINAAYLSIINETSPELEGIKDSGNLNFTNGVKAYNTDGVKTTEPLQKVNYHMRIAVPYYFQEKLGSKYSLKSDELYVLPDYRMSVYNDTIYKTEADGTTTIVCTNADLELDRNYLAFFNKKVNGEPVGVVVVLRYNECVVDTADTTSKKLYLTGRKITFTGNYSSSLDISMLNKDAMYYSTNTSGKQAVLPKNFAFSTDVGGSAGSKSEIYKNEGNHKDLNTSDLAVYIDFVTITSSNAVASSTPSEDDTESNIENTDTEYSCFVIIRNNYYIGNDGQLLNWLASDEAKAMNFVEEETLRKKIRGEFSFDSLAYEEWRKMQAIEAELGHDKDGVIFHIIRTVSIVFGAVLIILAITIAFLYWFDIFNTFTDFSLLYFISRGNIYPVADKDSIRYVSEYEGKTKFVTFKNVLFISALCCLAGLLFLNVEMLLEFFFWLYTYFMTKLGGL